MRKLWNTSVKVVGTVTIVGFLAFIILAIINKITEKPLGSTEPCFDDFFDDDLEDDFFADEEY